ncbi:MAG: DUF3253 domain-containing protein [Pseudomonadota bacterium]
MSSSAAETAIEQLLDERGVGKTICPSEAAKRLVLPHEDWRLKMDEIHSAVDAMVDAGSITLSWKGQPVRQRRGPYRIARR